ncbi:MAG: tRNA (adenosine(37)-N6)-threonylcarbamoyltransferase complex transferase subunit TsaD [Candidatus Promineifilaceae bacterium]|jgi:N6-L-threonylcarbamoyladenine synthase
MSEDKESASRILAIETSCDETAAAVVDNGRTILSNVIASQVDLHAQYGGVFPEVASRKHIEMIYPVVDQAMREAFIGFDDLDCIAVTRGPGLVGSLLVGVNMAKGLALARNKPLLGINHIEGHISSLWLTEYADDIQFPVVTLVVSGGHTDLFLVLDHGRYQYLGGTMDDAAGEAFDKVGRLLGLPFPGGPAIDAASENGNPTAYRFPRAVMQPEHGYNFSFSGLKTAVLRQTKQYRPEHMPVRDLAASFQAAVVEMLVEKTVRAAEDYGATAIHMAGGVSANRALRAVMTEAADLPVRFPPPELCTDNAAMIAAAAHHHLVNGRHDFLDMDVIPSLQLV